MEKKNLIYGKFKYYTWDNSFLKDFKWPVVLKTTSPFIFFLIKESTYYLNVYFSSSYQV